MPKIEIIKQATFLGRARLIGQVYDFDEISCESLVNGGFAKYLTTDAVKKLEKKMEEEAKAAPPPPVAPTPIVEGVIDHINRGGRIAPPLQDVKKKEEKKEAMEEKKEAKVEEKIEVTFKKIDKKNPARKKKRG